MILLETVTSKILLHHHLIHHLTIKFYDRTPEQQVLLGYSTQDEGTRDEVLESGEATTSMRTSRQPHGSVGGVVGQRAIAQSNSAGTADALFRYSAPEEVMTFPSTCGTCTSKCETRMLSLIFRIFKK